MSYTIEPMSVKQFVTDSQMKLPRFQRRAVWSDKQNFELCISIFQDYPVGVVIINKEIDSSWLLDGRQRRSALKEMRSNPTSVYSWARKYINFSTSEDPTSLSEKYWAKVEEYLQKDKSESSNDTDEDNTSSSDEEIIASFDAEKQRRGLKTLLDIILMVHQMRGTGMSSWQKLFDFTKYTALSYAPKKENQVVNPIKLREFILSLIKDVPELTEQTFVDYYDDTFAIPEDKKKKFLNDVSKKWEQISNSIDVIRRSEKIIEDARIGIINLTNVSPLDAQNIFSRINSGGTQLKAEELLSSKPFWNETITSNDPHLSIIVNKLYRNLEVEIPDNMVKWDVAATLLKRIKDNQLLFDAYKVSEEKNEVNMEQITLGFKLLSSIYQGGMSAKHVASLENNQEINWNLNIDELISDINSICQVLFNHNFFKYLGSWKKPISKLLGAAIVLEFITIIYKDWYEKGCPTAASAASRSFQRDAIILFDRLVYEYATGIWRGSGDSKMASHIANWKNRISPIETSQWEKLLIDACSGQYNGQQIAFKQLIPILYYRNTLDKKIPHTVDEDISFDIDHIIPQAKFSNNNLVDPLMKDSLTNLAILPSKDNESKNDKALNEITDTWLRTQIVEFSGIKEQDFEKYSDITNIEELKKDKITEYLTVFKTKRNSVMSN